MAELVLLPDLEQVTQRYLAARAEVAEQVADHVYTVIPNDPPEELVRLGRIPSAPIDSNPLWLDRALLQFDFYAGRKKRAYEIARVVLAALDDEEFRGTHEHDDEPAAVITGVEFGQFGWLPDAEYEPAKARYIATVAVLGHPAPSLSS